MEINKIKIETAEKGEATGIKTLDRYENFRNELKIYNQVDDILADPRIKIRQDQNKYLFNINGENLFAVDTPRLEERLNMFYDEKKQKEQRKAVEEAHVRVEGLEITYIKTKTIQELDDLEYEINKTQNKIEHATDIESIKYKVERLIAFFEQEKDLTNESIYGRFEGTKYDRKDRGLWKINKFEIKRRLKQLKKIKKQIEWLEKNKGKKYTIERKNADGDVEVKEVKMDDINAQDEETTLLQLNQRIEELGEEAPDFIKTRNEIILENGDTTPYYELILNNVNDAGKLKMAIKKVNDDYILLNKMNLSVDKRQALQQDLKRLQEYLEDYANHPNKPLKPFVPESGEAFENFCAIDPDLKQYTKLNKTAGKPSDGKESYEGGNNNNTNNRENNNNNTGNPERNNNTNNTGNNNTNNDRDFGDKNYIETFKEGGISGMLRKTLNMFPNMSAESKNTWTSLLVVGGVGFGVWKMARRLFSGKRSKNQKEKTPFRKRLLIAGGVTLGFNAFGTNPFKFAEQFIGGGLDPKTLKLQWPRAKTSVENPENELTVIELNEIFGPLPISKIKEFVDPKTFKLTEAGNNGLLLNFQGNDAASKEKRDLIERMRTNNDNDILKTSFATIGITPENINNLNENKTVKEYTDEFGYTIEGDTRDGEDDPRIDITNQVKDFNLTAEQKANLVKYGNILYDEKPGSSAQKVEFKEKDTKIYLKTYGERTMIDPEKLTISGYNKDNTAPIVFSGYKELMKAANLTNYLKSIFRGKATGTQFEPFQTAGLIGKLTWDRGDIMFNDGSSSLNPTHTEAIDGGRFGTLGTISPKLEENKEEYIKYLNSLNIWNNTRANENKPN